MGDFPDFSPDTLGITPLPISAPTAAAPAAPPVPAVAPKASGAMSHLGPLLALLPLAMARGGSPAVAALLNGYQGALIQQRGIHRQDTQDAQNLSEKQQAEKDRQTAEQDRVRQQGLQSRTAFLGQAQKGLDTIDSPDQLSSYSNYLTTAGQPYGIKPEDIAQITSSLTPSKLQQRAAQKKIADIGKTYSDAEIARLEQAGTLFQVGTEKMTLPQIRARSGGGAVDAQGNPVAVPQPAAKPPTRNTTEDEQLDTWAREQVNPQTGKPYGSFADLPFKQQNKARAELYQKPSTASEPLVSIKYKDPATGKSMEKFVPRSEAAGMSVESPESMTVQNRLASADAVTQTGNDIIAKLSDPAYAAKVGPVLGRYSSLRDFIGNPPPEYSELAGQIESYSLANMGVHGMRSAQGAQDIKNMLDAHHTPESIIAAIKGLNAFSQHFMQNEGRTPTDKQMPKTAPGGNPFRR